MHPSFTRSWELGPAPYSNPIPSYYVEDVPILYHYTDRAGLTGILNSRSFRVTNAFYLNDEQEILWGLNKCLDSIDRAAVGPVGERIERLIKNPLPELISSKFLGCFSTEPNDLAQWRAYGRAGAYAIEFPPEAARELVRLAGKAVLTPVNYDEADHNRIATSHATELLERYRQRGGPTWPPEEIDDEALNFLSIAANHALVMKHPDFKSESEWRLIRPYLLPHEPRAVVRPGRSMLRPQFDIDFTGSGAILDQIGIVVGPGPHQSLDEFAAGLLLDTVKVSPSAKPGKERVAVSSIPYREV